MPDCINPDSVKAIFLNDFFLPFEEFFANPVIFCVQIWEAKQSALLNSFLVLLAVVFVFNITPFMVMFLLVKGNNLFKDEALRNITNMVEDHIYHDQHISFMAFCYQL